MRTRFALQSHSENIADVPRDRLRAAYTRHRIYRTFSSREPAGIEFDFRRLETNEIAGAVRTRVWISSTVVFPTLFVRVYRPKVYLIRTVLREDDDKKKQKKIKTGKISPLEMFALP